MTKAPHNLKSTLTFMTADTYLFVTVALFMTVLEAFRFSAFSGIGHVSIVRVRFNGTLSTAFALVCANVNLFNSVPRQKALLEAVSTGIVSQVLLRGITRIGL